MRNLPRHHLVALVLLAACGTSDTTDVDVDVASVSVTPAAASVIVGSSIQFSAEAVTGSGTPVPGQTTTWTSSDGSIAAIDAGGVATGVQVGSTQITATVGGVSGSQTLTVSPDPCTTRTDVVLGPGDYATFQGNECLLLPAGSPGDMYRVALARPTLVANPLNTPTVTLSISPVLTAASPPSAQVPPAAAVAAAPRRDGVTGLLDRTRVLERLKWQDATRAFHNELRLRERSLGLRRSTPLPRPPSAPPVLADPPPTDLMFLDLDCFTTNEKQPVTLVGFSDHIALYQETAAHDTAAISTAAASELINFYDAHVRDMITDYFGSIPDIDANGRVIVVTTPELGENVAAAVYSGDFVPTIDGCTGSNEGETIYFAGDLIELLAPSGEDPVYFALGVLAHEAKHVVSLFNGIQRGNLAAGPPVFHDLWVEEGSAEVAQSTASRIAWAAVGGPALGQPITAEDILSTVQSNGGRETREISGLVDVLAGTVRSLSAQPNSVITDPTGAPDEHSFYQNSWHWHRFLGDAFGDASERMDSAFFRALTDPSTPAGGAAGELQLTGVADFDELFEHFVVAVSLHGTGHVAPFPIDTWDFVTAGSVFRNPNPDGDYPWPVTATETRQPDGTVISSTQWAPFESNSYTAAMGPSGLRFHDFRSDGSRAAQIHVAGVDGDDLLVVTRID
jgi:hypothetical protein